MGDQEAFLGIFLNLANNSIQSVGQGVNVEISIASATQQLLILYVKDNGPGIPATIAEKIFTPFFTTRNEGTGLGLAVAQATLRAHRGAIRYIPQQTGTTFEVSLALSHADNMLPSGSSQAAACFPAAITTHS
jgi:two-component system sensor histidine kinase FlrB